MADTQYRTVFINKLENYIKSSGLGSNPIVIRIRTPLDAAPTIFDNTLSHISEFITGSAAEHHMIVTYDPNQKGEARFTEHDWLPSNVDKETTKAVIGGDGQWRDGGILNEPRSEQAIIMGMQEVSGDQLSDFQDAMTWKSNNEDEYQLLDRADADNCQTATDEALHLSGIDIPTNTEGDVVPVGTIEGQQIEYSNDMDAEGNPIVVTDWQDKPDPSMPDFWDGLMGRNPSENPDVTGEDPVPPKVTSGGVINAGGQALVDQIADEQGWSDLQKFVAKSGVSSLRDINADGEITEYDLGTGARDKGFELKRRDADR